MTRSLEGGGLCLNEVLSQSIRRYIMLAEYNGGFTI